MGVVVEQVEAWMGRRLWGRVDEHEDQLLEMGRHVDRLYELVGELTAELHALEHETHRYML